MNTPFSGKEAVIISARIRAGLLQLAGPSVELDHFQLVTGISSHYLRPIEVISKPVAVLPTSPVAPPIAAPAGVRPTRTDFSSGTIRLCASCFTFFRVLVNRNEGIPNETLDISMFLSTVAIIVSAAR